MPWWSETVLNGIGGIKFKSRSYYPLITIDHAASLMPNVSQLHLDLDDEIRSLRATAG